MRFEWDSQKNVTNKKKHGVSFEAATFVFDDTAALSSIDDRYDDGRWFTIGRTGKRIVYVAHMVEEDDDEEEIIRIISAREATSRERRRYHNDR